MMEDPESEAASLDIDDRNDILDFLDEGKTIQETIDMCAKEEIKVSIEAVEFLKRNLGREAATLTDELLDKINEQYLKGKTIQEITKLVQLRKSTVQAVIAKFSAQTHDWLPGSQLYMKTTAKTFEQRLFPAITAYIECRDIKSLEESK